mmetsp:Transcript_43539/g.121374  ORF Transcript_43539/g.121374 Transcript_43539/m.121374 type:complete len:416 (-) Transcript_43539:1342-2589(-)
MVPGRAKLAQDVLRMTGGRAVGSREQEGRGSRACCRWPSGAVPLVLVGDRVEIEDLDLLPRVDELVQLPLGGTLHEGLALIVLDDQPHVAAERGLPHVGDAHVLDAVDADRHALPDLVRLRRPQGPRTPVDLGQHADLHHRAVHAHVLQEGGPVVDEERGAAGALAGLLRAHIRAVGLADASSEGHLVAEDLLVVRANLVEPSQHEACAHLRHAQQAHLSDPRVASWQRPRRRRVLAPSHFEILLDHLRLGLVHDTLHELERSQEAVQHHERELHDELLAPAERRGLGTCEVREPVHEVEGQVLLVDAAVRAPLPEHLLEAGEDGPGRGLRLHEPAVVELEPALRELHGAPLVLGEAPEGGQELRVVVHDVAQGMVVVSDRVSDRVTAVGSVLLLHLWKDHVHFHNVVDSREGKQ